MTEPELIARIAELEEVVRLRGERIETLTKLIEAKDRDARSASLAREQLARNRISQY